MRSWKTWVVAAAAAAVLCVGATVAQEMPKLPADIVLPQSGDSPGKVTFSHTAHLAFQGKPDCTVCHPKLAPITKAPKGAKRTPTTHAAMLKGAACGGCHGKTASNFDDCTKCHK